MYTPIVDCFLNGLTRQTVIGIAKKQHIPVIEQHIHPHEVAAADEVFITGSAVEVAPVSQVGAHFFKVGVITQAMTQAYHDLVREEAS